MKSNVWTEVDQAMADKIGIKLDEYLNEKEQSRRFLERFRETDWSPFLKLLPQPLVAE